jgi:exonuclease III
MEDSDIFLIQETKCAGQTAEDIIKRCWRNFESYQTDSKGASGGLTILCNPATVILNQILSTPCTITEHYRAISSDKEGMITNAYGLQISQDKDLFIQSLAYLGSLAESKRWIIGGDFNMILMLEEKQGGKKCLEQDSAKFQELIENLRLVDIENRNGTYTWTNKRSGNHQIACSLDRFLISKNILLEGPLVESNILLKESSDHWSVQLWVDTISTPKLTPFRFEIFFLSHPDFQEMACHWWSTAETLMGTKMYCFQQKLKHFKQ